MKLYKMMVWPAIDSTTPSYGFEIIRLAENQKKIC